MIMAKKTPLTPTHSEAEKLSTRSVRLPQRLWDLLAREAHKAMRSDNKQLEWILSERFGLTKDAEAE